VNRWVAWAYNVPPVAGSLFTKNYQIRLMESYLQNPKTHNDACRVPDLRSGPFIAVPMEKAHEIQRLLEYTRANMSEHLQFADNLLDFYDLLITKAKGESLDRFYEQIPARLRGYVELVYDYHHRPMVKCMENMLYRSSFYNEEFQSFHIFRQLRDDSRAFILNTPRLQQEDRIDWRIPLSSKLADEFFSLDLKPAPLDKIRDLLNLTERDDPVLMPMLTKNLAPRQERNGRQARIRYLGHACVLVEWKGVTILLDQDLGVAPEEGGSDRLTYENLPQEITYAMITHNHHDHFCLETLLRLRNRIDCLIVPRASGMFYGDVSLKLMAQRLGFRNVIELDSLDSVEIPDGEILSIPFLGEHADLPHSKTAYVVRTGRQKTLFAADSDCLDVHLYEHVRRNIGPIQTIFIGLECVGAPLSWSSGAFFPKRPDYEIEQSRRYKGCDAARALQLIDAVQGERLYVYAMGLEPWLEHHLGLSLKENSPQLREARKLLEAAGRRGLKSADLLCGVKDLSLED
jgi:L-ascorbate metabolism protein UlaG (beta-lactamase superfamily)